MDIFSVFVWPIPWFDLLVNITGLSMGGIALSHHKSSMAIAGFILAAIGLSPTIVNLKIGLLDLILKTYFQY
jgi:hypothetical protein